MSEFSIFWPTGTTGDGASTYTDTQLFSWLRRTFNSDMYADRGPLKGYNDELAVTAGSGKVTVGTGAAYVYGIPYENDAALDVAIPTPTSNTRVDRIVLRADWTAKTVRITRIAGTEGAGAPGITQTPGVTYDVKLAQVSITTGGVITVTDERQFCRFATEVTTENIADGAITAAKISGGAVGTSMLADGAVTAAKMADGAALAEILDDDGAGSGLDADLLDGQHGSYYAPATKGVTNGDAHDHNGGDGAQIDHANLANKGTNTHAQIDTAVTNSANHIAATSAVHGLAAGIHVMGAVGTGRHVESQRLNVGTVPANSSAFVDVTFANSYGAAPQVVATLAEPAATSEMTIYLTNTNSTTGVRVNVANMSGVDATTYVHVVVEGSD